MLKHGYSRISTDKISLSIIQIGYNHMSSPKIWGKYFWTTLHIAALGYPDNPSEQDKAAYRAFFEGFGQILPCKKCAKNYDQHLREIPITPALLTRESLFTWTVKLHNIVNKQTGKAQWASDYAKEFYLSGSYNDCNIANDAASLRTDVWRMILMCVILLNIIVVVYIVMYLHRKKT